jgi:hypothetical protein
MPRQAMKEICFYRRKELLSGGLYWTKVVYAKPDFQSTLFGNERNVDLAAALWLSVPVELLTFSPIGS